jgi:ubiquinone/menaquinone biosynthesis C-methylase UbiE
MTESADYEYRGLIAESWDLLRGDTSNWPDRAFYLNLIRERGQPVLDVGCGTGRLLLDYAAQGIDVDGVDNSPEMLALCREKGTAAGLAPTLYEQQMEELSLPRRYQTIIVPSSSFQLLVDAKAARDAMVRFRDHLEPGGTLAMPFMQLWSGPPQTANQARKWHKIQERERSDGAIVRRWVRARYDSEEQLEHAEDRYEVVVDGEIVREEQHNRSPATRWYTQEQSRDLFDEAGFVDLHLFGELTREDAEAKDRIWTLAGRRL